MPLTPTAHFPFSLQSQSVFGEETFWFPTPSQTFWPFQTANNFRPVTKALPPLPPVAHFRTHKKRRELACSLKLSFESEKVLPWPKTKRQSEERPPLLVLFP